MVQLRSLPDNLRQRYEAPKLVNNWCIQQVTRALMALRRYLAKQSHLGTYPGVSACPGHYGMLLLPQQLVRVA
jgi:hypothetical protein